MRFDRMMMGGALIALMAPVAVMAQATTPADYVKMAGAGDQYELQSSKLVMTSKDPKIKQFATMMVKDHTTSTAEVKKAAMMDHVKAGPPMLDADGKQMVAQLRAASGPARDAMYVDQQKMAHQKALALHQGYASDGSAPALKATAAKITPVVQSHIDMLNTMGSSTM